MSSYKIGPATVYIRIACDTKSTANLIYENIYERTQLISRANVEIFKFCHPIKRFRQGSVPLVSMTFSISFLQKYFLRYKESVVSLVKSKQELIII